MVVNQILQYSHFIISNVIREDSTSLPATCMIYLEEVILSFETLQNNTTTTNPKTKTLKPLLIGGLMDGFSPTYQHA